MFEIHWFAGAIQKLWENGKLAAWLPVRLSDSNLHHRFFFVSGAVSKEEETVPCTG
jgi:hypothetical protein